MSAAMKKAAVFLWLVLLFCSTASQAADAVLLYQIWNPPYKPADFVAPGSGATGAGPVRLSVQHVGPSRRAPTP